MTRDEFDGGWKMLEGVGWPGKADRNPEVYFGALRDLTSQQWAKAVATAIQAGSEFHPVPKMLREMAGSGPALNVEAVTAFEAVCEATIHRLRCAGKSSCACTEDRYDQHLIRERLGDGAADAFLAAGGAGAFARRVEGDPFLLQRFSGAYVERVKVDATAGLRALPSTPLPLSLPAPEISQEAAKVAVEQIRERAGVKAEPARQPLGPPVVEFTDERKAELAAQARAILDAEKVTA
jgi:hypothetical protein